MVSVPRPVLADLPFLLDQGRRTTATIANLEAQTKALQNQQKIVDQAIDSIQAFRSERLKRTEEQKAVFADIFGDTLSQLVGGLDSLDPAVTRSAVDAATARAFALADSGPEAMLAIGLRSIEQDAAEILGLRGAGEEVPETPTGQRGQTLPFGVGARGLTGLALPAARATVDTLIEESVRLGRGFVDDAIPALGRGLEALLPRGPNLFPGIGPQLEPTPDDMLNAIRNAGQNQQGGGF